MGGACWLLLFFYSDALCCSNSPVTPLPITTGIILFILIILFDFSLLEIKDSICFAPLLLENVNAVYQRAQLNEGLPFGQNYIPKYCLGYITCMSALSRSQLCFCQNLKQYFHAKNNIQCFPREYCSVKLFQINWYLMAYNSLQIRF